MISVRNDISSNLIHFTKGKDLEDAFKNLLSIIDSSTIYGTNNLVKGGYNCVCFSEAPLSFISDGLVNTENYSKYSPFGILVSKDFLFSLGGRPVIYQTDNEYNFLTEEQRWRHVTYNPLSDPIIDFTWEREWRINTEEFIIDPVNCAIIMPNSDWADHLISIHNNSQDWEILQYKMLLGEIAELYREYFPWRIFLLDDEL